MEQSDLGLFCLQILSWYQSQMYFFSKTDIFSKIAIYKLYLGVDLGSDIRLNLTITDQRIFIKMIFHI